VLLPQGTVIDGADIFIIGGNICGGGNTANVYHLDKSYLILVHLLGLRNLLLCSVTDVLADNHGRGIVCVVHRRFDFMPLAKGLVKNSSDNNVNIF
jgi:hypothetical protein